MILVVGSVNMDLVLQVDQLPNKGETVVGRTLKYVPGGKGANQAVAASRLGGNVAFVGKVGQDNFGEKLTQFLSSEKLDLSGLGKGTMLSGMALITVDAKGNNTIAVLHGANAEVDEKYVNDHVDLIRKANVVCTQLEIPTKSVEKLLTLGKQGNKTTILNLAPYIEIPRTVLKLVDYLVVNETELSNLVRSSQVI